MDKIEHKKISILHSDESIGDVFEKSKDKLNAKLRIPHLGRE